MYVHSNGVNSPSNHFTILCLLLYSVIKDITLRKVGYIGMDMLYRTLENMKSVLKEVDSLRKDMLILLIQRITVCSLLNIG